MKVTLGKTFSTNEERKTYQRKAWSLAAKHHSGAMFITVTPNENGKNTGLFSGVLNEKNIDQITINDIPSNAARMEISGRDPVACDLFFTKMLEILHGPILGFDMETKLPRKCGGLFGVPRAFVGGIECQGIGTLHVHLVVFLAGFPNDMEETLEKLAFDNQLQQRVLSFFDSEIPCSAESCSEKLTYPNCKSKNSLQNIEVSEQAYAPQFCSLVPCPTAQCNACKVTFGSDRILREYALALKEDFLKEFHDDSYCFPEYDEQSIYKSIATRAAVPKISELPGINASQAAILEHKIFALDLALLKQYHHWRHVPSCFKISLYVLKNACRYRFPRKCEQESTIDIDIDGNATILLKRIVGSEYINSYNEILLQIL